MLNKPRVLLVNQYFYPSDAATAVLLQELVEDLSGAFDITVLCESSGGAPSDPSQYNVQRLSLPKWFPEERATRSVSLRWLTCLIFTLRTLLRFVVSRRPSLVILASEPPFIDMVAGLWCVVLRQPFVIIVQDLYPEFAAAVGLRPLCYLERPLAALHSFVARGARKVITISDDHRELLARRGVISAEVIPNWCPTSVMVTEPAVIPSGYDVMTVQYAGNLGLACDIGALAAALADLKSRGLSQNIRIVVRGDGIKREQVEELASRYANVIIQPRVPVPQVAKAMSECHAHLILMPAALQGCVYPSKVNTIMAAGRPVIASVPGESSLAKFIVTRGTGYVSPAEDPSQLASCMVRCFEELRENPASFSEMGARGRRYVSDEWNRRLATERYRATLEDVLNEV